MLKIHFINVAEGDATLFEKTEGNETVRILVDAGRALITPDEGSVHRTAAEYLKKQGIETVDLLILTHLHTDHASGLGPVLDAVKVKKLYSSYYPKSFSLRVEPYPEEEWHLREIEEDLNLFAANLERMAASGTEFYTVTGDETVFERDGLTVRLIAPGETAVQGQNLIYDGMYIHADIPDRLRRWASDARNPNSLRVDICYGGKRVRVDGDYYAADAEREQLPHCDILKVAHHGDKKSVTEKTARMLSPQHAVISCQRKYVPRKDRPSKAVAERLRGAGAKVYYTDSYLEEGHKAIFRDAVVFTVAADGTVIAPEAN